MEKIEVHRKSQHPRPSRLAITAAALAAGLLVQTQGFAQVPSTSSAADAQTMSGPERAARSTWAAVMKNIPMPGKGCFHSSYPNVAWERVKCQETKARGRLAPRRSTLAPDVSGGVDYVAGSTQGLIYAAAGKFFLSGVTSVTSTGGQSGAIDGSDDYTLQINTNQAYTPACNGNGSCTVWQQFIYATDSQQNQAYLGMQYWIYGLNSCPSSNWTYPPGSTPQQGCYMNSDVITMPLIPVTDLGDVIFQGWASSDAGLGDCVWFNFGNEWFSAVCADDSVLGIANVWTQAEFNVFGDQSLSDAKFNNGAQIIVQLGIENGSSDPPVCLLPPFYGAATTGESNNLKLGACETGVGTVVNSFVTEPYIEFTEYAPVPSIPCLACGGGGGVRPTPPPIIK